MRPIKGAECDWLTRDGAGCGGCGAGLGVLAEGNLGMEKGEMSRKRRVVVIVREY